MFNFVIEQKLPNTELLKTDISVKEKSENVSGIYSHWTKAKANVKAIYSITWRQCNDIRNDTHDTIYIAIRNPWQQVISWIWLVQKLP